VLEQLDRDDAVDGAAAVVRRGDADVGEPAAGGLGLDAVALRAWLERLDANSAQALAVLERHGGRREARRQLAAWRLFMIAAAEIWGWRDGNEWLVSQYRLAPR
jgi:hypothetical protein